MLRNRNSSVAAIVMAAFVIASGMSAQDTTDSEQPITVKEKVVELNKEKCELLEKRLEIVKELFSQGSRSILEMLDAEFDYLTAKVACCETEAERIKVLRSRLENRRKLEQHRTARYNNGTGTMDDLMIASASRIDAHLALLKELPADATLQPAE